ncbi:MAG TPA: FGGY-family carbohydrate kinase [Candidatus Limnocylindrales bacterium]|nr:FGGY-family carbohydrate kinase [Candidatus Limnocylindrales bacterium]
MADHALAIDVGTQSVRALLFDPAGTLVAMGRVPIEPYVSPQPGWAEQDPEVWWTAIGEACRKLWTAAAAAAPAGGGPAVGPDAVAGVALTTQRVTLVVADEDNQPLRPAIVWLDQRRTEGLKPVGGFWGAAFRLGGVRETVARFQADAEANWIERFEPAVWKRIRRYGVLSSWLTARLTGDWVDSTASQVGYLPFDFKHSRWASRFDWKWQVARFNREWLPALVPPTGRLGALTAAAAEHLGVAAGTPLIAAAGDKQCEALGSGAVRPDVAALSFGTTASLGTTHRKYVEAIPLVPPYPAALPGAWFVELQVLRGFWMVEWFKREFGSSEISRAAGLDVPPEALFEELLAASSPGSQGLLLQPYWMPGVRYPGPEAKGAMIGFGDVHGRAHVYRAILEGLAYALREGAERTVKRSGVPIRELRISGGGSQSHAAVQLFADVFGLPASRPHTHEAAGLGAAIDVMLGLRIHADADDAVAAMVRVLDRFEPDPSANRTYEDLYRSVYLPMYDRLKPLYREIRRITGYPPAD